MGFRVQEYLEEGISAAKDGQAYRATQYLERVLMCEATFEQQATAHLWLAKLAPTDAERRTHLETVLSLDAQNSQARRDLAIMDGKLQPSAIINADTFAPPESTQPLSARRFVCQQCGGKMRYAPAEDRLRCDYCGQQITVLKAFQGGANIEEQDFAVTLATAEGHTQGNHPLVSKCQGCQALIVSQQQRALSCPYCGSHHVLATQMQHLVSPQTILHFSIEQADARKQLQAWVDQQVIGIHYQTSRVRGIYLPAWTFDVVTEVPWQVSQYVDDAISTYEGREASFHDDLLVPATHLLPYTFNAAFREFLLEGLVPYADAYLANDPAALHTVTLAEASLVARHEAYRQAARQAPAVRSRNKLAYFKNSPPKINVLSYKLILLPFWIGNYRYQQKTYLAVINGQSGKVFGEPPSGLLEKVLGKVL